MKLLLRHQFLLVLAAGLMFLTDLGSSALFNDDEARCAASAAEMISRKAWIVPTFNDELVADIPILNNWLTMAAYGRFGISEFSARFASAILAIGTTLLTYHLGRKLYSPEIGFLAGLVLCTTLLFSCAGRSASAGSVTTFFVTLSFTVYVWVIARQRGTNFCRRSVVSSKSHDTNASSEEESTSPVEEISQAPSIFARLIGVIRYVLGRWLFSIVVFVPMGLACLAGGPEVALLTAASLVLFLLVCRRYDDLELGTLEAPTGARWRVWAVTVAQVFRPRKIVAAIREINLPIGALIVVGVVIPWYMSVAAATNGAWVRGFIVNYSMSPFLNANTAFMQFVKLFLLMLGCFPWAAFIPVIIYRWWERLAFGAPWRESDQLLGCWVGVWFVSNALLSSKLPAAFLPLFPALALLLARYFADWTREKPDSSVYSFNLCCKATWIVGVLFAMGLTMVTFLYFPTEQWIALFGFVPAIAGYAAAKLLDQERRPLVIRTLTWSALLFAMLMVVVTPSRLHQYQDSPMFVAEARQFSKSNDVVIGTFEYFEPSLVFYTGKKVPHLKTARQAADFLSSHPHGYLIYSFNKLNQNTLNETIIGGGREISRHKNFFHGRELVLLGRN